MNSSSYLIGLLDQAQSIHSEISFQSNSELWILAFQDLSAYLLEILAIFGDDETPLPTRQLCANLLKSAFIEKKLFDSWVKKNEEVKSHAGARLLKHLLNSDDVIRRSAADCIAGICRVEFGTDNFKDIITELTENAMSANKDFRNVSILTLGKIAEDIEVKELESSIADQIYSVLIFSLQQNVSIEALSSFISYLPVCAKYFSRDVFD